MILAQPDQLKDVMKIFRKYKDIFPHVRSDNILEYIKKDCVVYENGCVITFGRYKRNILLGDVEILRGSYILHQIVVDEQGTGKAKQILEKFISYINGDIYLTVREDNLRARHFYEKYGFKQVGKINWKSGTINGLIYVNNKKADLDVFFTN